MPDDKTAPKSPISKPLPDLPVPDDDEAVKGGIDVTKVPPPAGPIPLPYPGVRPGRR